MDAGTYQDVRGLARMTVGELREKFLAVFGEASRCFHGEYLRKRIAWRLQANAEGDLSERARRRAAELANDADLRMRAPRDPGMPGSVEERTTPATGGVSPARDPRLPRPGTMLVREHHGRDIVVTVLEDRFEYDGRRYRSLSAIAREVTGSRWNGYLFFGIADVSKSQRRQA